jgi:hypothetical protein
MSQSDYIQYKKQNNLWNDRVKESASSILSSSSHLMYKQFYLENTSVNTLPVYSQLVPSNKQMVFQMEKPISPNCFPCPYLVNRKFKYRGLFNDSFKKYNYTYTRRTSGYHATTSGRFKDINTKVCPFIKNRIPSIQGDYCIPSE